MVVADVPTLYNQLGSWIAAQQEYESTNGQPAPLTGPQRKALYELYTAIKPAPPEPEVGEANWVGLLHRFRDAYPDPGFGFVEEQVDVPGSTPRFLCSVTIQEHSAPFPGPGYGLAADAAAAGKPSFARKKDAKQYAAKCAVEWLRANGRMPTNGDDVKFARPSLPRLPGPPAKKQKRKAPPLSPTPPALARGGLGGGGATDNQLDAQGDLSSVVLVEQYCRKLGFGAPKYELNEQEMAGFYSGHAEFASWETHPFPETLGKVKDILGKKVAKEKIAEEVLRALRRVDDERQTNLKRIMVERPGNGVGMGESTTPIKKEA